jgi:serine/threonine protein kinase
MELMTEPVTQVPRPAADTHTFVEWLDSLSAGECDEDAFLEGVGTLLQRAPDAGWELLALADQYYRRGRISAETFGSLKSHLHDLLMGTGRSGETSIPLPQTRGEVPAAANGASASRFRPAFTPAAAAPAAASAQTTAAPTAVSAPGVSSPRPNPSTPAAPPARAAASPPAVAHPAHPAAASPGPSAANGASSTGGARPLPPGTHFSQAPRATSGANLEAFRVPPAPRTPASPTAPFQAAASAHTSTPVRSAPAARAAPAPPPDRDDIGEASSSRPADRSLAVGDVLRDRYRVLGVLGQGGMGTVFEAVDLYRVERANDGQKVAIKVLHTAVIQRPQLFAELRREFQTLQSLSHPNIVRVHEFDRDGDVAFFTMEYLSGALLSRVLSSHASAPLYRPYALAIMRDVGAAVAHAHARGVVHGDLNPGNIFITDDGEVRVLDFGASHQLRRGPWISEFEGPQQVAVATPAYASCQLLEGEAADARDDIYALASVAYLLLTGNHSFYGHNALKARTLRLTPDRPRGLDGQQWKALRAGLRFERERRPADIRVWLDSLALGGAISHLPSLPKLWSPEPRRPSGMRWFALAAALMLIAACAWWATTHEDDVVTTRDAVTANLKAFFADSALARWWNQAPETADSAAATSAPPPATTPTAAAQIQPAPLPLAARAAPSSAPTSNPATPSAASPGSSTATSVTPTSATPISSTATSATPISASPSSATRASAAPVSALKSVGVGDAPAGDSRAALKAAAASRTAAAAAAAAAASSPAASPWRARVELTADTVDVLPSESVAHLVVRRTRSLKGDANFTWWTETGTAKPGQDFVPVKSQVETIENGKTSVSLLIPIVVDPRRRESRSFYVVIDQASDTAAVGPRTLSMVTIEGSAD